MVKRSHRAAYGVDYTPTKIELGPVTLTVQADNAVQGIDLVAQRLDDDSEVMHEIADRMVLMVRENILNGNFTPLLPETVERRKYPYLPAGGIGARVATGGSQPLVAGRSLLNGIEARSKVVYAAAQRGKDEWYGFLHDRGVGRLDRRTFMDLTAGHANELLMVYDEWLEGILEEDVN